MKSKKIYIEYPFIFLLGGILYMFLEILWRGYTHWTMGICGGISFLELYLIEKHFFSYPPLIKCTMGSILITVNEFITGCIVNILLGWNVWDYSNIPLNIKGQICIPFSFLWFLLCIPAFYIAKKIRITYFIETQESSY